MDEQHEGDKILHQDAVEDVVKQVLDEPGVSGPLVWTEIEVSTVESDWDNGGGAWTFNGDGTITSLAGGTEGWMSLVLPTVSFSAGLGSVVRVPATFTAEAELVICIATERNEESPVVGGDCIVTGESAPYNLEFRGLLAGNAVVPDTTLELSTDEHEFVVVSQGSMVATFLDGIAIASGNPGVTDPAAFESQPRLVIDNYNGTADAIIVDLARIQVFVLGLPAA